MVAQKSSDPFILLDCDEPDVRRLLDSPTSAQLKNIIGKKQKQMHKP